MRRIIAIRLRIAPTLRLFPLPTSANAQFASGAAGSREAAKERQGVSRETFGSFHPIGSNPREVPEKERPPRLRGSVIPGGEAGIHASASRTPTPPSQARSGENLKTCHRHVFLTVFHLIGSNPCEVSEKEKVPAVAGTYKFWRRSRDSNPRCPCGAYSLSRRAPSASRSLLRKQLEMIPEFGAARKQNFRITRESHVAGGFTPSAGAATAPATTQAARIGPPRAAQTHPLPSARRGYFRNIFAKMFSGQGRLGMTLAFAVISSL